MDPWGSGVDYHRPPRSRKKVENGVLSLCFSPLTDTMSAIARITLVVVNLCLHVIGLILIVVGILISTQSGFVRPYLDKIEDQYEGFVKELPAPFTDFVPPSDSFDFGPLLNLMGYAFVGLGTGAGVISLMGCLGGWLAKQKYLAIYVNLVLMLCIAELVVVITVYQKRSIGKSVMSNSLKSYEGLKTNDSYSLAWNGLMVYLHCCGVDDYRDFEKLEHWPPAEFSRLFEFQTPIACCKVPENFTSCAVVGKATPLNNNMEKGCYDILFDGVFYHSFTITTITMVFIFQFGLMVLTTWILFGLKDVSK